MVERLVLLRTIDSLWVEHLTELDDMRRGIGLRGYGGTDPLERVQARGVQALRGAARLHPPPGRHDHLPRPGPASSRPDADAAARPGSTGAADGQAASPLGAAPRRPRCDGVGRLGGDEPAGIASAAAPPPAPRPPAAGRAAPARPRRRHAARDARAAGRRGSAARPAAAARRAAQSSAATIRAIAAAASSTRSATVADASAGDDVPLTSVRLSAFLRNSRLDPLASAGRLPILGETRRRLLFRCSTRPLGRAPASAASRAEGGARDRLKSGAIDDELVDLIACERDCRTCSYAAWLDCDGNCGVCPHNGYCPCVNPVVARSKTALRIIELRPLLLQDLRGRS